MSNNEILKSMIGESNLEVLSRIYQDSSLPNHVRKRARFKIAKIWQFHNRSESAKKGVATKKAKKVLLQNDATNV